MKSTFAILCVVLLDLVYHGQAIENAQQSGQFMQKLVTSVRKMKEMNTAGLNDVEAPVSRSFYAVSIDLEIRLRDGTVSGLTDMRLVGVPKHSKEGNVSTIIANLRFPTLKIKYNKVDVSASPYRKVFIHGFVGTVKDMQAKVTLTVDENDGVVTVDEVEVQGGKDSGFRFFGGQAQKQSYQLVRGQDVVEPIMENVSDVVGETTRNLLESAATD